MLKSKLAPHLKGIKIGPPCLRCGEVINPKPKWQPQGWLHKKCEKDSLGSLALEGETLVVLVDGPERYVHLGGYTPPVGYGFSAVPRGSFPMLIKLPDAPAGVTQ